MNIEINQLIASHHDVVSMLGWLLYNRVDQNGGLNKEEVEQLVKIVNDDSVRKIFDFGFDEGFEEGICK